MSKKLLKIAFIITLALLSSLAIIACKDQQEPHEHEWDDGVVVNTPSCEETELIKYTCKTCKESYTEDGKVVEHSYSSEWSYDEHSHWKEATCGHNVKGEFQDHYTVMAYRYDKYRHWKLCASCGAIVEDNIHEAGEHGYCITCGSEVTYTEGLEYELSADQTYYVLKGRGSAIMTEVIIPSHVEGLPVKEIATGAFENTIGLVGLSIPDTVESIGAYAFSGCGSLSEVVIGDGVKKIGKDAFSDCDYLAFNEKGNLKHLGNDRNPYHAIISAKDTTITNCDVQSGVRVVADQAFSGCASLVKVNVLDLVAWSKASVTDAKSGPFASGANLYHAGKKVTALTIPAMVDVVGDAVYAGANIESVDLNGASVGRASFAYSKVRSAVGFGKNVGVASFIQCESLVVINLAGAENVGAQAFSYCSALDTVNLAGVKEIGAMAFDNCVKLEEIKIRASVDKIGDSAFRACTNLTDLVFEEGVEEIGAYAFYGCGGLLDVTLPNGLNKLGGEAFSYCTGMKRIIVPESVTVIDSGAFYGCDKLTVYLTAIAVPETFAEGWLGNAKVALGGTWEMVNGIPTVKQ